MAGRDNPLCVYCRNITVDDGARDRCGIDRGFRCPDVNRQRLDEAAWCDDVVILLLLTMIGLQAVEPLGRRQQCKNLPPSCTLLTLRARRTVLIPLNTIRVPRNIDTVAW